jgi:transposase-like protein
MQVLSNGKVRRSKSEWQKIHELYGSSDLSQSEFCSRENISLTSFQNWRRKLERSASQGFVELNSEPKLKGSRIELEFPSGLLLRISG